MTDLGNIFGIIAFMIWLASGGYAFASLSRSADSQQAVGTLFVACILIAPFMAAWAFVDRGAPLQQAEDDRQ